MIKVTIYLLIGATLLVESINAQCLQCNSNDDESCNNPDGSQLSRSCASGAKCYVRVVDDGRVIRGCQSELAQTVLEKCSDREDEVSCKTCNFSNCNAGLFPHHRLFCHFCHDGISGVNCSLAIEGTPAPCKRYKADEKCIVRKDGDKVIRQCLSDFEDCSKQKSCESCDSHGCNNKYYNAGVTMQQSVVFIGFAFLMTKLFH